MTNEVNRGSGASGVKEQAREKVAEAKERTTEQIESRLAEQKSRAAETLSGVSQSLLLSSQHLREQQQSQASHYVERAAEQVDRLAHYLEARDVSDIVHQVETLARRKPAVFLGGAVAVGFVAARFLKSTSHPEVRSESGHETRQVHRGYDEGVLTRDDGRPAPDVVTPRFR